MQNKTGDSPVYRYLFTRTPSEFPGTMGMGGKVPLVRLGVRHSAEIPYVFGDLKLLKAPWQSVDFKISDAMMDYWSNFATTGNPNGSNLPHWPRYDSQDRHQVMILGPHIHSRPAEHQKRLEFLDFYLARYRKK